MDFQILKQNFITKLIEKLNQENKGQSNEILTDSNISIFMYQTEFQDYLKDEFNVDLSNVSGDIDSIFAMEFENGKFLNETNNLEETEEIFLGLLNEFINDGNVKTTIDKDKNGEISKDETVEYLETLNGENNKNFFATKMFNKEEKDNSLDFLGSATTNLDEKTKNILNKLLDTNNDGVLSDEEKTASKELLNALDGTTSELSASDLEKLKNYISGLGNLSEEEIINKLKSLDGNADNFSADDIKALTNTTSPTTPETTDTSSFSDSTSSGNNSGSSTSGSNGANDSSNKNFENMSIAELEKELSGADTKISNSQNAYLEELDKIDKDLATKIKDTNEKIKVANDKIKEAQGKISEYNNRISAIDGEISTLEGQLASAKAAKNNSTEGVDIQHAAEAPEYNIAGIEAKIAELKAEKEDIKNNKIPELENEITTKEGEITSFQAELTGYESEVAKLGESHPDLKADFDAYKQAVSDKTKIQSMLETRKADQAKMNNGEYDRPDAGEASKDYRFLEEYSFDNLPLTVTVDGKVYNCVGFEGYDVDGDGKKEFQINSWEEAQRYLDNGGVENLGKYGNMQCHNYSDIVGQFILGEANAEFVKALYDETNNSEYGDKDTAGLMAKDSKWNPRNFARCESKDRDEERAIIENELQNGRPCVIGVGGSEHWVLAVGMSSDGDILIWDSYEGSLEKLGQTRTGDSEKLQRNLNVNNGVMVFCEDYEYDYGDPMINYWEYLKQGQDYIRANG